MSHVLSDKFPSHPLSKPTLINSPYHPPLNSKYSSSDHMSTSTLNFPLSPTGHRALANTDGLPDRSKFSSRNSNSLSLSLEEDPHTGPRFDLEPHLLLPDDQLTGGATSGESQEDQETCIEGSSSLDESYDEPKRSDYRFPSIKGVPPSASPYQMSSLASDMSGLSIQNTYDRDRLANRHKSSLSFFNPGAVHRSSESPSLVNYKRLTSVHSASTRVLSEMDTRHVNDSPNPRGRHFRSISYNFGSTDSLRNDYSQQNVSHHDNYPYRSTNELTPEMLPPISTSVSRRQSLVGDASPNTNGSRRESFGIQFGHELTGPKHVKLLEKGYNHYLDFAQSDSDYLFSSLKSVVTQSLEINRQLKQILTNRRQEPSHEALEDVIQSSDDQIRSLTEYLLEASVVPSPRSQPPPPSRHRFPEDQFGYESTEFSDQDFPKFTPTLDRRANLSRNFREEEASPLVSHSRSERARSSLGSFSSRSALIRTPEPFASPRQHSSGHRSSLSVQPLRNSFIANHSKSAHQSLGDPTQGRLSHTGFRHTTHSPLDRRMSPHSFATPKWTPATRDSTPELEYRHPPQHSVTHSPNYPATPPLDSRYRVPRVQRYSSQHI